MRHFFLIIFQKYYQLLILGILDMPGYFHQKRYCKFVELWCFYACKKWTPSLDSSLRYCKDIANLLLWILRKCLITAIKNDTITLFETLSKVLKSTRTKLWCLPAYKKLHLWLLLWDIVKTLQTCYFGNFGNAWPFPSKS